MGTGRQQDGLSYEEWIVQGARSCRFCSARKATERQVAGELGITRLVELL